MSQVKTREIAGYFLTFTDEEKVFLTESFEELGFELSPDGIKQALLYAIHAALDEEYPPEEGGRGEEDAADRVIRGLSQMVKQNPEKLRMYAAFAGSIIKNVLTKKAGASH